MLEDRREKTKVAERQENRRADLQAGREARRQRQAGGEAG
jgi:hypothetical protein